jgi:hypothetical protein
VKRRAALAFALVSLVACSQVGREIVGQQRKMTGESECSQARRCGQLEVEAPEDLPEAAGPVDLSGCTFEPSCPIGSRACPSSKSSSDELGLAWSSDQLASLTCSLARLAPGDDDGAVLQADGSALRQLNLRVTSDDAASIELTRASLEHVSFELHGPVTLRLIDSVKLDDVRVTADGAAQIVIEGGHGDGLALAADSGSAIMRRVAFEHLRVQLAQLELESVQLRSAEIAAQRFDATDATLHHLAVQADRVLLAASTVSMSEFGACTAFSGIAGSFESTHVSACLEPHRIYGAMFNLSRIDGALALDRAGLTLTELGAADPGSADVWDSTLNRVTFCGDRQAFAFGGHSTVKCGHCDLAETPVEPEACLGKMAEFFLESTDSCAGFEGPPACAAGEPQRMRPPL